MAVSSILLKQPNLDSIDCRHALSSVDRQLSPRRIGVINARPRWGRHSFA
jgi:hypothetical protein